MRIWSQQPGLYRPADFGVAAGWMHASQSPLPDHQSRGQRLAERVLDGEFIPRPTVADQLLAMPQTAPLSASSPAPANPVESAETPAAHTAKILFYLLHSSTDQLSASPLGRSVDQLV